MAAAMKFALFAELATTMMMQTRALKRYEAQQLSLRSGGPDFPLNVSSSKGRHGPPGFPLACVMGMSCPVKGRSPGAALKWESGRSMEDCWKDCMADSACVAAISHQTSGVCYLLGRTYDDNFQEKECGVWVSNKDPSSSCRGCDVSLESPEECPTPSPTPSEAVTAFGDPHVGNLKGEQFDILQADYHNFLVIPRGSSSDDERAGKYQSLLQVRAKVSPLGALCDGSLYVTELLFTGQWLGDVRSLEFITSVDGDVDAGKAMRIRAGNAPALLNVSGFRASVPAALAEVTVFHPELPEALNQHVETLLVKLRLGPSISKVRMVYQKEKQGYSNALWITSTGLGKIEEEIGGILGLDDHSLAAMQPPECTAAATGSTLLGTRASGTVHASALTEEETEEEN